jgi:hypothetical protein
MRILLIYTTAPDTPGSFRWSALLSILKAEAHQQNGQAPRPCFFVAAPHQDFAQIPRPTPKKQPPAESRRRVSLKWSLDCLKEGPIAAALQVIGDAHQHHRYQA